MTRTTASLFVSLLLATVSNVNAFTVSPAATGIKSLSQTSSTIGAAPLPPVVSYSKSLTSSKLQASGLSDGAVSIDRDFRLAGIFLAAGIVLDQIPWIQLTLGPIVTLLGILFLVQTFRVEFICGESAFELGGTIEDENVVVGGENKWAYDSFVNYEFFPKGWEDSPQGPILVYFKEVSNMCSMVFNMTGNVLCFAPHDDGPWLIF